MKWPEFELDSLINRLVDYRGKTPTKTESGVKLVTAKVIKEGRILENVQHEYISEVDYDEVMRRGIPKIDDIIITTEAPLGEVAIIKNEEKIAIAQRVILFSPNPKIADPQYLYYCFFTTLIQERLNARATGTTVPGISNPSLRAIKIPLPPLPTQRRIAEILGRYDALIDNYQKQINALESMAQELYREWFVRGRCPYAESGEDGGLPVGWEKKPVEDCFEILGGGTPSRDEPNFWEDGTVNWFTPTDITGSGGFFLRESSEKITNEGLNSSSARLFPAYSVMMTSRATIGAVAINTEKATTNQGFIVCLPNQQFSFAFIYLWVTHNKHIFEMLASGATFLEIPKSIFKKIDIIVPADRVLESFDKTAIPIFKKIENLQSQLTTLRQTRDALLPKLLSGQLGVEEMV